MVDALPHLIRFIYCNVLSYLRECQQSIRRGRGAMIEIDADDFQPSTSHVDIWRLSLDAGMGDLGDSLACLNQQEQERANKLKTLTRQRQFIITRACLKRILARISNKQAPQIRLSHGERGKPHIDEQFRGKPIYFNLSHSDKQSMIALTLGQELGIDIEKIQAHRDHRLLGRRCFSGREQSRLNRLRDDELYRAFYACWTRKEAFIKAIGEGIGYGLDKFDVSPDTEAGWSRINLRQTTAGDKAWFNISLECAPGYAAALALSDTEVGLRYRTPVPVSLRS